jgi:hypothetical protein
MMEDVGTSANQLIQLDSTGKIPAVDGSLVTGVVAGMSGSSDPTISTNPSTGVGTKFKNTTDGEIFICTDATAGENVWKNVGEGTGDVKPYHGWGSSYGYCAAGSLAGPTWPNVNTIDKFSLVTTSNATDVGDLLGTRGNNGKASSSTHGYSAGGEVNVIEKWSMTTDGNSTDVGDLVSPTVGATEGCWSTTYGYMAGGNPTNNIIQKYPFATDTNATDVADLTRTGWTDGAGGNQSSDYGYVIGGSVQPRGSPGQAWEDINKWAFATDGNATDIGNLTIGSWSVGSTSSSTYGYTMGGATTALGRGNIIDKFSFASDGNATDVGDMLQATQRTFGISSTTHGYGAGGTNPTWPGTPSYHPVWTSIEKFSFASDGNSVDTTQDLTQARCSGAASQI